VNPSPATSCRFDPCGKGFTATWNIEALDRAVVVESTSLEAGCEGETVTSPKAGEGG
jgi:hypothetical protein